MRQWSVALRNSHFFSQIKTFAFLLKINAEPRSTMSSISIHIPDLINFIIFSNIYGANECDWLLFNAHSSKVLLRLFFFNSYGAGTERERKKKEWIIQNLMKQRENVCTIFILLVTFAVAAAAALISIWAVVSSISSLNRRAVTRTKLVAYTCTAVDLYCMCICVHIEWKR